MSAAIITPSILRHSNQSSARRGLSSWSVHFVLISTILLNFIVCVLRTRGLPVGSKTVAAGEIATYALALYLARREVSLTAIGIAITLVLYMLSIRTFANSDADPKILRDIAIPFIFTAFGRACGNQKQADRVVYLLVCIVTVGSLFETFFADTYSHFVDILTFYYERGGLSGISLDQMARNTPGNHFYTGGSRTMDEGRTIGSYLGDLVGVHRVSSVFLEPVSAAAFGGVAFSWMVHRYSKTSIIVIGFMFLSFLNIMLADGRFAALTCFIAIIVCLFRFSLGSVAVFCLPFVAIALLLLDGAYSTGVIDNGLSGRLLMSGTLLYSWGPQEWLALRSSAISPEDCGYGWLLSNMGLLPLIGLWSLLAFQGSLTFVERKWRTIVALYVVLALCVGPAVLSVKTAALVWFLYGVSIRSQRGWQ